MSRDFDLILFGATGFTGQLVAEYLAAHGPKDLRWALAGRNEGKLEGVRDTLAAVRPRLADLPLVVADSGDEASLAAMAARTKVICTTVGPYLTYGLPLVKAAAEAGTHVCDLTGEAPFIRQSIDGYHEVAKASGARITHCCGYDSIPSDLGTLMVQDAMIAAGAPAERVKTVVGPTKGGFSGGTAASMMAVMEVAADKDIRRMLARPYTLDPDPTVKGADGRDQAGPEHDDLLGLWTAPFFMAPINTRVVRRSHALMGRPWGERFSYTETMATGRGATGWLTAWTITGVMGAVLVGASTPTTRGLLAKVLPDPGEGPDKEARDNGFFRHLVVGQGADPSHRMFGRVIGVQDPGYGETAKMLGEAALCLALDELPDAAGVLTPSTAMGQVLIERLRTAGMAWDVEPWPASGAPKP